MKFIPQKIQARRRKPHHMTADDLADQAALQTFALERGGLDNARQHPDDLTIDQLRAEIARLEAAVPDPEPSHGGKP